MKKQSYILTVFALFFFSATSNCQELKTASDTISYLYKTYFALSKGVSDATSSIEVVKDKQSQIEKQVDDKYKKFSDELEVTKKEVDKKIGTSLSEIQKVEKDNLEKEILGTASFAGSANGGLVAIDAQLKNTKWLNQITRLNNATNDELGFSLKDVFKELLGRHITPKIKSGEDAERVNNFVTGIINNPLTDIAKGVFPIVNTVASFISGISFNNKRISEKDFENFMKDLSKYTEHYEKLDFATKEFNNGINHLQTRTDALQTILNNFVLERASKIKDLNDKLRTNGDVEAILTQYYNYEYLQSELKNISDSSKSYPVAIAQLKNLHPSFTLNQVQFIKDELNYLTNQYIAAIDAYQKELKKTITASNSLVIGDKEAGVKKIETKLVELDSNFESVKSSFKRSVNLPDIEHKYKLIINNK